MKIKKIITINLQLLQRCLVFLIGKIVTMQFINYPYKNNKKKKWCRSNPTLLLPPNLVARKRYMEFDIFKCSFKAL
jgi:hypothetical protein